MQEGHDVQYLLGMVCRMGRGCRTCREDRICSMGMVCRRWKA